MFTQIIVSQVKKSYKVLMIHGCGFQVKKFEVDDSAGYKTINFMLFVSQNISPFAKPLAYPIHWDGTELYTS